MNAKYVDEDYDIEEEDLLALRKQYWNVFNFEDEDHIQYFYRCLTKKEYFDFSAICTQDDGEFDTLEFENYIVNTCVVLPSSFSVETAKAGVISSLAKAILENSGFTDDSEKFTNMLNAAKIDMVEPLNQVACYIVEAFPHLSLEDVDNMPISKILWLFSRADYIFRVIRGVDVNILSPQEYLSINQIETGIEDLDQGANMEEDYYEEASSYSSQTQHKATESETTISSGSMADFPELKEIEAFMQGKLR
jgi:hypothetical protein